jgi:hypothetical protein
MQPYMYFYHLDILTLLTSLGCLILVLKIAPGLPFRPS